MCCYVHGEAASLRGRADFAHSCKGLSHQLLELMFIAAVLVVPDCKLIVYA